MFFIEKFAIPFFAVIAFVSTLLGFVGTWSHLVTEESTLELFTPHLLVTGIACAVVTVLLKIILIDFEENKVGTPLWSKGLTALSLCAVLFGFHGCTFGSTKAGWPEFYAWCVGVGSIGLTIVVCTYLARLARTHGSK